MTDAWTALVKGCLAFVHARAVTLTGTSLADSGALVGSVANGDGKADRKAKLEKLKQDIKALQPSVKVVTDKLVPQITAAKTAIDALGEDLKDPFEAQDAINATFHLANLMTAIDKAMDAIAEAMAPGNSPADVQTRKDIKAIKAPWQQPFADMANATSSTFDLLCSQLFGIDNASKQISQAVDWDQAKGRLSSIIGNSGKHELGALSFENIQIEAFLVLLGEVNFGLMVKAGMSAGLRGDPTMAKLIPGQGAKTDSTSVAVTLDSKDGLTLGDGKDHRITLPVRLAVNGVELREIAISKPAAKNSDGKARIDLTTTIAGKFGSAVAVVAEGGGVTLESSNGGPFSVSPKPPDGLGFRIDAGVVRGGGFLRYREDSDDYGGIIDLKIGPVGLTAMGMVSPDPFSFVVVIGVHFFPKINLSFGFTLNGVGGILAVDRRLSVDALTGALKDGVVSNLLFPDDPVAAAPGILNQLAAVFPPEQGGFVVGPIVELGWGSEAGLVRAKIGIVIALPDPKIVALGSLQITIPPPEIKNVPRLVDLKADIAAIFEPSQIYIQASLTQSKLAGVTISGDFGALVRWSGGATFAASAGGFFPKYKMPTELAGLRRLTMVMAPPVKWLQVTVTGYVALTANSVQWGGAVDLSAKVGPVKGEGHFGVDALFSWSPRFAFEFQVAASVKITFKGHSIAGASFNGTVSGAAPWLLKGHASVSILFWDVDFNVGPVSWGGEDKEALPPVDVLATVQQALEADAAWLALPAPGVDAIVRLRPAPDDMLLLQPHSIIQAKQTSIPLDTPIQRVGAYPSSVGQVGLTNPRIGTGPDLPAMVSHVEEDFAPGQFLNLTADEQMARPDFERRPAGFQVASADSVQYAPSPVEAHYRWETFYPREKVKNLQLFAFPISRLSPVLLKRSAAAAARTRSANPYARRVAQKVEIADSGLKQIQPLDQLSGAVSAAMTTVEAATSLKAMGGASMDKQMVTMGLQP